MKNLIFPATALLLAAQMFSQDVLTLRTGVKYQVKLMEITDTDIRFKMYNNQAGPYYTISRSSFESIVYENGTREEFALSPQETSQTVVVNGYNISASSSVGTDDQSHSINIVTESSFPSQPAAAQSARVAEKKVTFGEVMGAIFYTGMLALDVAAKVEQTKCSRHHKQGHTCRK